MILSNKYVNALQSCMNELQKLTRNTELFKECWSLGEQSIVNPLIALRTLDNDGELDHLDESDYDLVVSMATEEAKLWCGKEEVSVNYEESIRHILSLVYELQRVLFHITQLNRLQSGVNALRDEMGDWTDYVFDEPVDVSDDD